MTRSEYLTKPQCLQPSIVRFWSVIKSSAQGGTSLGAVRAQRGPSAQGARSHTLCCPLAQGRWPQWISLGAGSRVLKPLSSSTHTQHHNHCHAHSTCRHERPRDRLSQHACSLFMITSKWAIKPGCIRKLICSAAQTFHILPKGNFLPSSQSSAFLTVFQRRSQNAHISLMMRGNSSIISKKCCRILAPEVVFRITGSWPSMYLQIRNCLFYFCICSFF